MGKSKTLMLRTEGLKNSDNITANVVMRAALEVQSSSPVSTIHSVTQLLVQSYVLFVGLISSFLFADT
jgi:hypothetical protein